MENVATIQGAPVTPEVFIKNASTMQKENIKRVLLLYEEKVVHIGDFCMWTGKMHHFRAYFNNAPIDINFSKGGERIYRSLLENNPHVDQVLNLAWDDLDLEAYDMVWIASMKEGLFLDFLQEKFGHRFYDDLFKLTVFSFSHIVLGRDKCDHAVFPVAGEFIEFARTTLHGELYISAEEKVWANELLKSKGLKEEEHLFVLLDTTSRKDKLISIHVYFELLASLLSVPDTKVLVYDAEDVGKESFYEAWLDAELFERMIFISNLGLRKDVVLLASPQLKLLLGPCTGLIHCASAIYNHQVRNGMPVEEVPLMITYTGYYPKIEGNANMWWGDSPLVNCIMIKETGNEKQLRLLAELSDEEKEQNDSLACSEYTTEMLIDFVKSKLKI